MLLQLLLSTGALRRPVLKREASNKHPSVPSPSHPGQAGVPLQGKRSEYAAPSTLSWVFHSLSGEATHKTGCLPSGADQPLNMEIGLLCGMLGGERGEEKGGDEGCWEHQGSEWTQKGGSSPGQAWSQCENSKCRCLQEELAGILSTEALRLQWPRCARKGCSQEGENQRGGTGTAATHPKTASLLLLPFSLLFLFILHFCLVWVEVRGQLEGASSLLPSCVT